METHDELIQQIITRLELEPLPFEGGFFKQAFKSKEIIPRSGLPARYPSERALGTAIYYLMTPRPEGFSALHRLRTDEILHFYLGDPVDSLLLHPDGRSQHVTLGSDILNGQTPQLVIPTGAWQGHRVRPGGRFALIGSTMAPGYEDEDFILGERAALLAQYPYEAEWIDLLTR